MQPRRVLGPPVEPARAITELTGQRVVQACSSFGSVPPSEPGETWAHLVPLIDPKLGDEALAYGITQSVPSVDGNGDDDGGAPVKVPYHFVAVRSGATIVAFDSMNFVSQVQLPQVPMNVVKAQIDKLDRVR
jgi:hypothetical protein